MWVSFRGDVFFFARFRSPPWVSRGCFLRRLSVVGMFFLSSPGWDLFRETGEVSVDLVRLPSAPWFVPSAVNLN